MTDIAGLALANAIPLEVKKDGLQQRQNGDWVLRVVIQACDMDQRITTAPMGTRFVAALVEINEQELPVQGQPRQEAPAKPQPVEDKPPAGAKRGVRLWQEISPQTQAGIRCDDPIFLAFLRENFATEWRESREDAPESVRLLCGVSSRSELATNHKARVLWKQLDDQFQAWKALEHA